MFQFPGFASAIGGWHACARRVAPFGNPRIIRVFAPTHGLSQLVTSFVASESQGILHVPFSPFLIPKQSRLFSRQNFTRLTLCVLFFFFFDLLVILPL